MRFASPWFLSLLIVIPLYIWMKFFRKPARRLNDPGVQVSSLQLFFHKPSFLEKAYKIISEVLLSLALLFLIFAMARPQGGKDIQSNKNFGIDIVLAMDTSASMSYVDTIPSDLPTRQFMGERIYMDRNKKLENLNRLNTAKSVIKQYVEKQTYNRIGIVEFASYSFTRCPLTLDKTMLSDILDDLQISAHGQFTAIGMGISTAVNRLKHSTAKSKVIILLTDGDNNAGLIDPLTAADIARNKKIKIYTISLGNPDHFLAPMDMQMQAYRLHSGASVNEESLQEIANMTGGKFYRATDEESLKSIYEEIDKLEKTQITVKRRVLYKELFIQFSLMGILFLLAYIIFNSTILKLP